MEDFEYKYYLNHLHEQCNILINACEQYDHGHFYFAKQMSGVLRTLLKDPENTRNSQTRSLLKSLEVKDTMKFYNTGYEAKDPIINISIVGMVNVPSTAPLSSDKEHIYLPVLNNSPLIDVKWIDFNSWWKSNVLVSKCESHNVSFTRERIILGMAEQDGGVHIDRYNKVDKDYFNIAQHIYKPFMHVSNSGEEHNILFLEYALIRQLSHEILISINRAFNICSKYKPTNQHNLRGVHESMLKIPGILAKEDGYKSIRTENPFKSLEFKPIKTPPNAAYMKIII